MVAPSGENLTALLNTLSSTWRMRRASTISRRSPSVIAQVNRTCFALAWPAIATVALSTMSWSAAGEKSYGMLPECSLV